MRVNLPKIFSLWKIEKNTKKRKNKLDHWSPQHGKEGKFVTSVEYFIWKFNFHFHWKLFVFITCRHVNFFENRVKWWFGIFIIMVNHYFESGGFSSQTIFRKEFPAKFKNLAGKSKFWLENLVPFRNYHMIILKIKNNVNKIKLMLN